METSWIVKDFKSKAYNYLQKIKDLNLKELSADELKLNEELMCFLIGDLSDREREVVSLVIEGLSNHEIGNKLFVEEKTIKFHLTSIFKKKNVKNKAELIVEYYKDELRKIQRDKELLQQQINGLPKGSN